MEYKQLPTLDQWAALRTVVETGSVSEAARLLHVGQPAVSKRLRALDRCYGAALLSRIGGRLELSEAGEKVYLLAVQTLDRDQALREDLLALAVGTTSLRLEATTAIGEHLLPDLLVDFAERYPDYRIHSRMNYSHRIEIHLARGIADLALLESAPDHPEILVQKWLDDELVLVCGRQHPLWQVGMIQLEDLAAHSFVLRESRSGQRVALNQALGSVGITNLRVVMEVGSSKAIVEILDASRHLSFLPRFMVDEAIERGELSRIKVAGFRIQRTVWIARHRSRLDHPVAEAFIGMAREKN